MSKMSHLRDQVVKLTARVQWLEGLPKLDKGLFVEFRAVKKILYDITETQGSLSKRIEFLMEQTGIAGDEYDPLQSVEGESVDRNEGPPFPYREPREETPF